jgi:hypothetical protein
MSSEWSSAFKQFDLRQQELNYFLWTTELTYGIVKSRQILEEYSAGERACLALEDVICEAWFPTSKGNVKYSKTVGHMQKQLDKNFVVVLSSVSVLFVTYFEVFVQQRFPDFSAEYRKKRKPMPAPANLVRALQDKYPSLQIKPDLTLKADLIKAIRNVYVHEGMEGIPRKIDAPSVQNWKERVKTRSYSQEHIDKAVTDVVGSAIRKSNNASRNGKDLPVEFFYALFTFTDIRNFAEALETLK